MTGVTGCASGEDCSTIDNNPMDFNGHGTHTAGTMAAITNNARAVAGIAGGFGDGTTASPGNGCKIMCMRIGWSDAAGNGFVRMDFAAQAINYVVGMKQRGVNVAAINCSWGSSNSGGIAAALDAAMNNDILVVHAAGNSNSSLADYMGSRTEILNVAATDEAGLRASFSNYGSWVDIAAPGVSIISTYQVGTDPIPDYVAVLDGTSMAAPHCVGVAGLLESFNPSLTRADKFSLMVNNTCPAGSPNIGGILNAKKALDAIAPPCDVTANFTGAPTSGNVPLTVNFTDASTGPVTSWSWDFGDGGASTAQNPSHVYSAAGTYTVSLTVTTATCNNTLTRTDYITVTDPNAWVTLSSDDFEAGFGSYTDGGADCIRYTGGTHAHQGVAAIDIQDNTASSLFSHTAAYNVTAYNTLEVSFWFKAVSMENGEDFWVQYFNGSTWVTVGDFNAGTDFVNNTFNNRVVTISRSQHNFPTNARIRFRCDAGDNNDDVYIDEVVFRATTATTPSINSAPALASADPVPREYALEQNYPNPFNAGTVIPFTLLEGGDVQLVVYDILGRTVRRLAAGFFPEGSHTVVFDGRDADGQPLASGVYLYRLVASGSVQTRKMVLLK
ncbi:MAG TPA: S8 family serine peptidase [bacterium]|nr:S8 family serine peptidase [bacterium]